MKYDCIIIGGGAAGLMCAATAGKRGRRVLVVDHANRVGKKILMSGGGRCNFTNLHVESNQFISANPHFCKSALSRYGSADFIALIDKYQLAYHEKTQGQLFCDNKAQDILNVLLAECEQAAVEIRTRCNIEQVATGEQGFALSTSQGELHGLSLVIATGGLSIPSMGATGLGYDLARQFGLQVKPTEASLVPFVLRDMWLNLAQELAGVAFEAEIQCGKKRFKDGLLFTHRGISGPAVLQITNYWHSGDAIVVDFLPAVDLAEVLKQLRNSGSKQEIKNAIGHYLPKRFVQSWLAIDAELGSGNQALHQCSDRFISKIAQHFHCWQLVPPDTEGYRTAEVTRGGVDTNEISSKTFEAKKVPGLYFIGEVLDVTGWLGGYNFQWAWASGYCAGQEV